MVKVFLSSLNAKMLLILCSVFLLDHGRSIEALRRFVLVLGLFFLVVGFGFIFLVFLYFGLVFLVEVNYSY